MSSLVSLVNGSNPTRKAVKALWVKNNCRTKTTPQDSEGRVKRPTENTIVNK